LREARQEANTAELALAERTASLEATSAQLSDSGAHIKCREFVSLEMSLCVV
jgi:hypothetical protein